MVLNTRSNIARALELSGDPASALVEFTEILATVRSAEIDAETEASYRVQTALALLRLGRLVEAKAMVTGALAMLVDLVPVTDPTRIGAHTVLGLVLLAEGNADAAESSLAVAYAACQQALPVSDAQRATATVILGRARLAQGSTAEGIALITAGFDVYSRWGLAHPDDVAAARRALEEAGVTIGR